jgi:membrane protease YdiL (CAAX protease family)
LVDQPAPSKSRLWRIIQFPLIRILIALTFLAIGLVILLLISGLFSSTIALRIISLSAIVVVYLTYRLYVWLIEKRATSELAFTGALSELSAGLLTGALLFTVTIGILWLLGYYQVTGINGGSALIMNVGISLLSGFVEEVIFRGVIFRILEEWLGTWLALVMSALLFGFAHIANPNATIISAAAIALEAGLLLAAAYLVTRRLWFAIGLHIAWNYTQGNIFGVAVSGIQFKGFLQSKLVGPPLLSGGGFGAEASVVAVVVCLIGFVILFIRADQKGHLMPPFWARKTLSTDLARERGN